jgi:hypothetical protein
MLRVIEPPHFCAALERAYFNLWIEARSPLRPNRGAAECACADSILSNSRINQ